MAVLGSDHYIADEALFRQLLQTAGEAAQQGYLVTLGIEPTFPSTGFGYIQRGDPVGEFNGHQIYKVKKFKEKPSQSQAEAMIADGQHDWNSGMFIWRVDRILAEIDRQMPDLYAGLQKIRQALGLASHLVVGFVVNAVRLDKTHQRTLLPFISDPEDEILTILQPKIEARVFTCHGLHVKKNILTLHQAAEM